MCVLHGLLVGCRSVKRREVRLVGGFRPSRWRWRANEPPEDTRTKFRMVQLKRCMLYSKTPWAFNIIPPTCNGGRRYPFRNDRSNKRQGQQDAERNGDRG